MIHNSFLGIVVARQEGKEIRSARVLDCPLVNLAKFEREELSGDLNIRNFRKEKGCRFPCEQSFLLP